METRLKLQKLQGLLHKMSFYYTQDFKKIDFRKNPELYKVGKGEQGVLLVEPYKSEILPHWRFRTPEIATESSEKIYTMFLTYVDKKDFVGADMARKFLQMGFTRSRRYANHKSGKKYSEIKKESANSITEIPPYSDPKNQQHFVKTKLNKILPLEVDVEKAKSAEIFYEKYSLAKDNPTYLEMEKAWQEKYG